MFPPGRRAILSDVLCNSLSEGPDTGLNRSGALGCKGLRRLAPRAAICAASGGHDSHEKHCALQYPHETPTTPVRFLRRPKANMSVDEFPSRASTC